MSQSERESQWVLYGTEACHLCEQAQALIVPVMQDMGCQLEHCDISESEAMVARYGTRIPVLALSDGSVELNWPFDSAAVQRLIEFAALG